MSKAKKVLDEARETHNPELDLADKGLSSFEELPGLCKYQNQRILKELYGFLHFWVNIMVGYFHAEWSLAQLLKKL